MRNLIKNLYDFTINDLDALQDTMQDRLDFEQDREPESDGMVRDNWENRVGDLEEIIDMIDSCETEEEFQEIIDAIDSFQAEYGGLSRLKVM